jgi:serine/threonine protein kinase
LLNLDSLYPRYGEIHILNVTLQENLLLDSNFQLKVADFGLSAINNDPDQDPAAFLLRTECGTKSYMPPEMLMRWPYHGSQADIWSAIVVLFIMLSGNPPFQIANNQDWWFKQIITNKRDRFWKAHLKSAPFFPVSSQEFIDRVLIPDPRNRPTINELKNDPWMTQNILTPITLAGEMRQRKQTVDLRKEQEKQAELAKMQTQKGGQDGCFDPFARVMRSVVAPALPADVNLSPNSIYYSSTPAIELLHSLVQKCQSFSWKVEQKEEQFRLKVVSPSYAGQIEWVIQVYSSISGLNVVHFTRRSGDLLEFFKLVKSLSDQETPGTNPFQSKSKNDEENESKEDVINDDENEDVISDDIDPL